MSLSQKAQSDDVSYKLNGYLEEGGMYVKLWDERGIAEFIFLVMWNAYSVVSETCIRYVSRHVTLVTTYDHVYTNDHHVYNTFKPCFLSKS